MTDSRYDYCKCATCAREYQRIDFHGNPHVILCGNPVESLPRAWGSNPNLIDCNAQRRITKALG